MNAVLHWKSRLKYHNIFQIDCLRVYFEMNIDIKCRNCQEQTNPNTIKYREGMKPEGTYMKGDILK